MVNFTGSIKAYNLQNNILWELGYQNGKNSFRKTVLNAPQKIENGKLKVASINKVQTIEECTYYYWVTYWTDGSVVYEYLGSSCSQLCDALKISKGISKDSTLRIKVNCGGGGGGGGTTILNSEFRFPKDSNYATKYPKTYNLVKKLYDNSLNIPGILDCLKSYSHMTNQELFDALTFGKGPVIKISDINSNHIGPTRYGFFNASDPNTINLDSKIVTDYENGVGLSEKSLSFFLALTILHETVHYGNTVAQFNEGISDFGDGFEICAYGLNFDSPGDVNIYLNKK
jgi:hypothetical protein